MNEQLIEDLEFTIMQLEVRIVGLKVLRRTLKKINDEQNIKKSDN